MYPILCIDDDPDIQIIVKKTLSTDHGLLFVETLKNARIAMSSHRFSLILLDVLLPDGDGISFCAEILNDPQYKDTPIFILSGKCNPEDIVEGFGVGADDYITKPFKVQELRARIDAKLKKLHLMQVQDYQLGNLRFDLECLQVFVDYEKNALTLSPKEFAILNYLCKHPEKTFSREQIIDTIWGNGVHITDRSVDSHISRIRKKIKASNIEIISVQGFGYQVKLNGNPNPTQTTTINYKTLYSLKSLDEPNSKSIICELIEKYLTYLPSLIKDLKTAIDSAQSQEVYKLAHKLKSSSGMLGVETFQKSAALIEASAHTAHRDELLQHYCNLESNLAKITTLLHRVYEKENINSS